MEFTTLPPEVISALIHSGPGAESLANAAAAWQQLSANLEDAADNYAASLSSMDESLVRPVVGGDVPVRHAVRDVAAHHRAAGSADRSGGTVRSGRLQLCSGVRGSDGHRRRQPDASRTAIGHQRIWAKPSGHRPNRIRVPDHVGEQRGGDDPLSGGLLPGIHPAAVDVADLDDQPVGPENASQFGDAAPRPPRRGPRSRRQPAAALPTAFDPNAGFVGVANTYANQFISSGFPINMLSYLAQNQSAQALQGVNSQVSQGLSEGENALGGAAANLGGGAAGALGALGQSGGGLSALGAAGLGEVNTSAALGAAVPMGNLSAPPSAAPLLATPVQLASAATPLGTGGAPGMPMLPPLMPPPISPGSGWRKRKAQKYEDIAIGNELKGKVMKPPPSAG